MSEKGDLARGDFVRGDLPRLPTLLPPPALNEGEAARPRGVLLPLPARETEERRRGVVLCSLGAAVGLIAPPNSPTSSPTMYGSVSVSIASGVWSVTPGLAVRREPLREPLTGVGMRLAVGEAAIPGEVGESREKMA
jgi:hypothetical protein